MKNTTLSRAIKLAILASGATALSAPAVAQDSSNDNELEEIITTGSRIKQDVSDAPRPITVMDKLDLELSGLDNVADVLRNTTFNTYGSFRERSGTSFGQVALVSLRGLGADYTAVLINGRRVPGNPITGGSSVDLNSIPLSAVERIELLTDSASAVYGADAIGGVINIIFREDFDGAEAEVGLEVPSQDGAETQYANLTIGSSSDRSSIVFSGEYYKRDPIFDADRFYSAAEVRDNPAGGRPRIQDTTGVSVGGNTGFETDFSGAFQLGDCDPSIYVPLTGPFFGAPATEGCGFAYANRSMMTGGIERISTFLNASYELSPDHNVYIESRLTRAETFGRYAPPVGFFTVLANAPTNPFVEVVDDQITGGERNIFAFHRFIGHGNRDETHAITEFDNVIGAEGALGESGINYDAYVRFYKYNNRNEGDTYVIDSVITELAGSGAYDVNNPLSQDPAHLAAVAQSSATLLRDIETDYAAAGLTLDGEAWDMPAGSAGWAAGLEWADEDYQDQYDSQREAGNIIGSAGNSAGGVRDRWAAFGELQIPLLDTLDANVAVRYDDYSDFGNKTSPQVSLRFSPIDQLTFRASWGEGFKAPNLSELYQELSQSFNNGRDIVQCRAQGIADADCPQFQFENFTGGNPDLQAEESESFNVGVIAEPIEGLRFSVDYFNIELTNKVNSLSVQETIDLVADGVALPPGVRIVRGADLPGGVPGVIDFIEKPFANLSSQTVKGFDVRAHYDWETDNAGDFSVNIDYSQIDEFSEITLEGQPRVEFAGESVGAPKFQAALNLRWMYGDFTVNTISRFIDSHGTDTRVWDSYNRHDLTLNYITPWDGSVTLGVRNIADEDPILENGTTWEDSPGLFLYDVAGRTIFASYKHEF